MTCKHAVLTFEISPHAEHAGYIRAPAEKLVAAALPSGTASKQTSSTSISTFPAPLLLPSDELALDSHCPPQSLRSWLREKDRNPLTSDRNVIYVAAPPRIDSNADFMRSWAHPQTHGSPSADVTIPSFEDVVDYLKAFYHGLPVKNLAPKPSFTSWDKSKSKTKAKIPKYIGLDISTECVGIRTRASPDGIFASQLNLDDLLDAAISTLPEDAYALLLLVDHDLFESDDDEFVCGRAYGGSRVAVISTARYHPLLDHKHNVDRLHAWPASHCAEYIKKCCASAEPSSKRPKKKAKLQSEVPLISAQSTSPEPSPSPIHAALSAFTSFPLNPTSPAALSSLWLGRVCRTASHELGHCFGIEHCVYYACSMQGSSSLAEDSRQPPYLCPIDLVKVLHATGTTVESRYQALISFCARHQDNQLFVSYAAWIQAHMDRSMCQEADKVAI
ncbi:hypothetical protein C0991_001059 [Blastosporella zonata]|nr:hypothetical protein C0991_001059 [Blastosporella zonata]